MRMAHETGKSQARDALTKAPFTVAEAARIGLTEHDLRSSEYVRPWRGVRIPAADADALEARCRALAALVHPMSAISHETALDLLGLPRRLGDQDALLHVTVPHGTGLAATVPSLRGVCGHARSFNEGEVLSLGGLRVTTPLRTWCDVASERWPLEDLVALGDAILMRRGEAAEALLAKIAIVWGPRRGAVMLRAAAQLCRAGAASPMESRLRLLVMLGGLPEPSLNHDVVLDGRWLHRPDLAWPKYRAGVDYDGGTHLRGAPRQRRRDIARREALDESGWVLRVVTADDVLRRPQATTERIAQLLRERGARI